jgi:hypothetical protein
LRLSDVVEAIEAIRSHLNKGDLNDGLVYDAVRVRLIEIGEAVKGAVPSYSSWSPTARGEPSPACATTSPIATSTPTTLSCRTSWTTSSTPLLRAVRTLSDRMQDADEAT